MAAKKPKLFSLEFFREAGRAGGKKRFASMSAHELAAHQKAAAKAKKKAAKRKKQRKGSSDV